MIKDMLQNMFLLLFCFYILNLYFWGKLGFYVNSRFFFFTLVFGVIATFFSIVNLYFLSNRLFKQKKLRFKVGIDILVLGIILVLIFVFPPTTLSQRSYKNQIVNLNSVADITSSTIFDKFSSDSSFWNIRDWIVYLNTEPDKSNYLGRKAKVEGFIYQEDALGDSIFRVSRFKLSCCVIDATPTGILVYLEDWESKFGSGDWVRVEGIFDEVGAFSEAVIKSESVTKIEIPDSPYI